MKVDLRRKSQLAHFIFFWDSCLVWEGLTHPFNLNPAEDFKEMGASKESSEWVQRAVERWLRKHLIPPLATLPTVLGW